MPMIIHATMIIPSLNKEECPVDGGTMWLNKSTSKEVSLFMEFQWNIALLNNE